MTIRNGMKRGVLNMNLSEIKSKLDKLDGNELKVVNRLIDRLISTPEIKNSAKPSEIIERCGTPEDYQLAIEGSTEKSSI